MKKKTLFLVLVLLYCFVSFSTANKLKINSLNNEKPKLDSARIKALLVSARKLQISDPDSAFILISNALYLSEKIGWEIGIAKSYNSMGLSAFFRGDYIIALEYYKKAIKQYDKLEVLNKYPQSEILLKKAQINCNIGIVYVYQGNYDGALEKYWSALKIQNQFNKESEIQLTYGNIALAYYNKDNYDSSLYYNFKSLNMAEGKDSVSMENSIMNIGVIYDEQGKYSKAIEYYLRALRIAEAIRDSVGQASLLNNIGFVYFELNNHSRAFECYKKSLEIAQNIQRKPEEAECYGNIGYMYLSKNNYTEALNYLSKSSELFKEIGDSASYAEQVGKMGLLFYNQKDFSKALNYYNISLKINLNTGKQKGIISMLTNIATIYMHQNKLSLADSLLQNALKMVSKANDPWMVSLIHLTLAEVYSEMKNWQKSVYYFSEYKISSDSLSQKNKINESYQLLMNYENEKKEAQAHAKKAEEELRKKDTFKKQALLSLIFVIYFILFIRFLRHERINQKLLKILSIICLGLIIEYIMLLVHPFLEHKLHGNFWQMQIAAAFIFLILYPLHNYFLNKWIKPRLGS